MLRRRLTTAGAGLAAVAVTMLTTAPSASAAATTYTVTTDPVQAAAGWLATQFVNRTHLPAPNGDHLESGGFTSYGENADVILGLAAAHAGRSKIDTALAYLRAHADAYGDLSKALGGPYDGSVGKLALAAIVGEADPTRFGGFNLMKTLRDDECKAPSPPPVKPSDFPGPCAATGAARNIFSSTSESLVVLAEARADNSQPSTAALTYLTSLQCMSGGFTGGTAACKSGAADIDSTSYAIMALAAAGGHAPAIKSAVKWLVHQQAAGGYWVTQDIPNANSTGLAAAALHSQGVDVSAARTWLRSQQVRAGSPGAGALKYAGSISPTTTSATSFSVLATAQALTGLVDGGSLATVTATGAATDIALFVPVTSLSATTVQAGHQHTATGVGFVAGEKVQAVIHSSAVTVATAKAGPLGSVKVTYTVPSSIGAGAHTVTLTGLTSGLTAERAITVTVPASATPSAGISTATPQPGAGTKTVAATGQDSRRLYGVSAAGLLAVLAGAALLVVGRRRGH